MESSYTWWETAFVHRLIGNERLRSNLRGAPGLGLPRLEGCTWQQSPVIRIHLPGLDPAKARSQEYSALTVELSVGSFRSATHVIPIPFSLYHRNRPVAILFLINFKTSLKALKTVPKGYLEEMVWRKCTVPGEWTKLLFNYLAASRANVVHVISKALEELWTRFDSFDHRCF